MRDLRTLSFLKEFEDHVVHAHAPEEAEPRDTGVESDSE
jgi:hypothetical protein